MADKATGVCKLIDADATIHGSLLATPFSSGAMKEAFDVCLPTFSIINSVF
jgi:hypothetical protein